MRIANRRWLLILLASVALLAASPLWSCWWVRWRIVSLSRGDVESISLITNLANRYPACWCDDLEIVETIAGCVPDRFEGYMAGRTLRFARTGGAEWGAAVISMMEDEGEGLRSAYLFAALESIAGQRSACPEGVLAALTNRLVMACQMRESGDRVDLVVRIGIGVLISHPGAVARLKGGLDAESLAWFDERLGAMTW